MSQVIGGDCSGSAQNTTWNQREMSSKRHHRDKSIFCIGNREKSHFRDAKPINTICIQMIVRVFVERCPDNSEHDDHTWTQGVYVHIAWLKRSDTPYRTHQTAQDLSIDACYHVPPVNNRSECLLQAPDASRPSQSKQENWECPISAARAQTNAQPAQYM
jgi:hypothetical protein